MSDVSGLRGLAAAVAQEVLNPLAAVGLHGELLLSALADGDPRRESAEALVREVRRLDRNLRALRLFAGERADGPGPVDLAAAASAAAADPSLDGPPARFEGSPLPAHGDRELLRAAAFGLVAHARSRAERDDPPEVHARASAEALTLDVTVPGRRPDLESLEPFGGRAARGLALGPALAREAARAHGGDLTVGPGPRSGTLYRIRLPRKKKVLGTVFRQPAATPGGGA